MIFDLNNFEQCIEKNTFAEVHWSIAEVKMCGCLSLVCVFALALESLFYLKVEFASRKTKNKLNKLNINIEWVATLFKKNVRNFACS